MSALIFVALAVAWAVYLIPQALRHHEASDSARTVEGFSHRLRVLARREPAEAGKGGTARLVVSPGKPAPALESNVIVEVPEKPLPIQEYRTRREAARAAARRRRRVLGSLIALLLVVAVVTGVGYAPYVSLAAPGALLVAWLVACRLMVRKEQSVLARSRPLRVGASVPEDLESAEHVIEDPAEGPITEEFAVVVVDEDDTEPPAAPAAPAVRTPGGWDPVPVTLPTYVGKEPAARRTVRTIDLESTGVWTSGRTAADAALAREAEEAERAARESSATRRPGSAEQRRASGS